MRKNTLARARLDGAGWAHPYGHGLFSPIVYSDGGNGAGSGSDSSAAGDGTGAGTPPPPAAGPWDGFTWDGRDDSLPSDVAKALKEARAEAGKARTTAKENAATQARQELLATFTKAVGLDTDDNKPLTAEELTRQLTTATTERTVAQEDAAAARIELHVFRTATRLGADAEALLDSRSFCDAIDAIDAEDPKKFNEEVETAISNALSANQQLRAGQVPRRGGGDFAGGPGTQGRPTSLQDAVSAALGG